MRKISVIIPAHNAEKHVNEVIESVLAQSCPVYEIIVVDDGSTDNTREAIQKCFERQGHKDARTQKRSHAIETQGHQDTRTHLKCIHQKNKGPAAARNRGIKESSGEYIAFLDADDLWRPDKLQKQMQILEDSEYGMVYSDMSHKNGDMLVNRSYLKEREYRHMLSGDIYRDLLWENFIFTPTVIVKKEILDETGGFDESLRICEDYKMWLKIAKRHKIGFVDEPLVIRRRFGANVTDNRLLYAQSRMKLLKELLDENRDNAAHRKIIERQLSGLYFDLGYWFWKDNNFSEARECFSRSIWSGNRALKSIAYYMACEAKNRFRYLPKQAVAKPE